MIRQNKTRYILCLPLLRRLVVLSGILSGLLALIRWSLKTSPSHRNVLLGMAQYTNVLNSEPLSKLNNVEPFLQKMLHRRNI